MTPDQILSHDARVLSQTQREYYFDNGYLLVDKLISDAWLTKLRNVTDEFIERSKAETESGRVFDIAPGHSESAPQMRRLKRPDEQHETFWEFATDVIADVVADLVGPDVVFHHSKLNFKWNDGKDDVHWHQDAQFYPHTNYNVLAVGTYINDVSFAEGPIGVIPKSHDAQLFNQYNDQGEWTGGLQPIDVDRLNTKDVVYLEGPAGSITVHSCRMVHCSPPSSVSGGRPLLINAYSSADALPYTPHPDKSKHAGKIVRGNPARWAHHDPRPCLIPPDWSGGYSSIFAAQAGEDTTAM